LLVEKGSDLNKQDSDGQTVLHYCCSNDQVEIVKYLLKNKKLLNINIKDNDGQRAVETTDNKELISLINSIS
jgi:ankyrin repeat protein